MAPEAVNSYCSDHPEVLAMILLEGQGGEAQEDKLLRFGPWEEIVHLK
jgi:hypothetical protein